VSAPALVAITIRTSIVLTVLSIGLSATPTHAFSVLRSPMRLLQSMWAMMVVVPLCAAVVASSFELEPDVKFALAALSVSPVPPFWPAKSRRAGGDESYTVGLLVASSLLSIVMIPLVLETFGILFSIKIAIPMAKIASLTATTILLPLVVGMSIRAVASVVAYRSARAVGLAGTACQGDCLSAERPSVHRCRRGDGSIRRRCCGLRRRDGRQSEELHREGDHRARPTPGDRDSTGHPS